MGCGSSTSAEQPTTTTTTTKTTTGDTKATKSEPTPKPPSAPAPEPAKSKSSYDEKFVKEALDAHNMLRRKHGAAALTHAPDLTEYAQKWANHLVKLGTMKHSDCNHDSGRIGENIYYSWGSNGTQADGKTATQSWYDEIKDYNFESGGFAMNTGHFTQVVWEGTKEMGIAYAYSSDGNTVYVVANYRPPGNFMGQFQENVKPLR